MKPKIKPLPAQRQNPKDRQTPAYKSPATNHTNKPTKSPHYKRGERKSNPKRRESDTAEFIQAIHEATASLDLALAMYGVELRAQLFSDEEITAKQRAAFRRAADKIINEREN